MHGGDGGGGGGGETCDDSGRCGDNMRDYAAGRGGAATQGSSSGEVLCVA